MYDDILVVTDGTDPGDRAVEQALDLAEADDARLHALYVVDVPKDWDVAVERSEEEGERLVEAVAAAGAERGVEVHKRFRYGRRRTEIVEYARSHDVDLIVVGSEDRSGISRVLQPRDTAERVLRRTDRPVLGVGSDADPAST